MADIHSGDYPGQLHYEEIKRLLEVLKGQAADPAATDEQKALDAEIERKLILQTQ